MSAYRPFPPRYPTAWSTSSFSLDTCGSMKDWSLRELTLDQGEGAPRDTGIVAFELIR